MATRGLEAPGGGRKATAIEAVALARRADGKLHPLGGNLYLRSPSRAGGAAHWVCRYRMAGARRDAGLGRFDARGETGLTLAQARDAAAALLVDVRQGRDPIADKAQAKAEAIAQARAVEVATKVRAITFREVAEDYIAAHEAAWRNDKHRQQWGSTLAAYAYPILGDLPPAAITTEHVLSALRPIWTTKPETAGRVRQRIEAVLSAAKARGLRSGENPAALRDNLDHLLPKRRKVQTVRHHPAVAWTEAPALMASLALVEGVAARVARFAVLCASRSGEVRGMVWGEVDLAARLWTVPANRMKGGKAHRVPLSDAAAVMLIEAQGAGDPAAGGALVFPAPRAAGLPLSDMACTATLRKLRRDDGTPWTDAAGATITLHGCARSTFSDWAAETGTAPPAVVEACLAHAVADRVEAAYRRGDMLDRRRGVMQAWADFLAGKAAAQAGAEVIAFPGAAA